MVAPPSTEKSSVMVAMLKPGEPRATDQVLADDSARNEPTVPLLSTPELTVIRTDAPGMTGYDHVPGTPVLWSVGLLPPVADHEMVPSGFSVRVPVESVAVL